MSEYCMETLVDVTASELCTHSSEKPCPRFAECLSCGPLCGEDSDLGADIAKSVSQLKRETLTRPAIFLGAGTCGLGAGAGETLEAVKKYLADKNIDADVIETGCIGLCVAEPILDVQLPGRTRISFSKVSYDKVETLLDAAMAANCSLEAAGCEVLAQFRPAEQQKPYEGVRYLDEHPFFAPQTRWVLANCGLIDPSSIEEYIARGGYSAFSKAMRTNTPAELCDEVESSGLRGRGGGGFLTGMKWKFALNAPGDQKYLICNADEGDPGAFMDRAVIEGDPHRLIEGMCIAAYAIGATKAYVYIRAEYPLAISRLYKAIDQAKEYGILGSNIFASGFNLELIIKKGAGAFVCGEETALIASIEGKRGMPRPRPPFPAVRGLFDHPTIINNVETLANLPAVVGNGSEWFSALGTETSKGTKVFALSGNVTNTGLVEVAMGTTVRQIVFDIGGGIPNSRAYKSVQIGGPSGGCIPVQHLDIEVDYESLKTVGAMMGSGGLVVMDEDTCMVDVAKFFMGFIQRESCGKCIPCREGTRRMLEILERITSSYRSESGTDALKRFQGVIALTELAEVIKDTSLCGLGQTAPNPVLSTLKYFREEYEAHVYERRCPAGVCKDLRSYRIDADKCRGCTLCTRKCPVDAISGELKGPHVIDQDLCIACGECAAVCKFDAVVIE